MDLELQELQGGVVGFDFEDPDPIGGEGDHRRLGGGDPLFEVVAVYVYAVAVVAGDSEPYGLSPFDRYAVWGWADPSFGDRGCDPHVRRGAAGWPRGSLPGGAVPVATVMMAAGLAGAGDPGCR